MCRINYWISLELIFLFIFSSTVYSFDFTDKPINNSKWTKKYDIYFNKYTKRYFGPGFEYKWFKSQSIAESALNADAESWVGAKGLMQIMPATYRDIKEHNEFIIGKIENPRWNIEAGIYYDKYLFNNWKAKRPFIDRLAFTFASYNAGMGNILKGQVECNETMQSDSDCNLWINIISSAHKVKSWRHVETLGYVKRIFSLMGK